MHSKTPIDAPTNKVKDTLLQSLQLYTVQEFNGNAATQVYYVLYLPGIALDLDAFGDGTASSLLTAEPVLTEFCDVRLDARRDEPGRLLVDR